MHLARIAFGLLIAASLGAGCEPCLDGGDNGLPPPGEGMYRLVFSNVVSRETVLHVDGEYAGRVCAETEYASVGNFPVSTRSTIEIHALATGSRCLISPNCSTDCGAQTCDGPAVIDTTPFSGQIYATGFIWRGE